MSMPVETGWVCPRCSHKNKATVFQSINTNYSPNVVDQILSGELFRSTCSSCGYVARLNYDFLYHDLVHKSMIWVLDKNAPDYEERVRDVRKTPTLYKHTRIVANTDELREKVSCLELGKDDRIIEVFKIFIKNEFDQTRPDSKLNAIRFLYLNGIPKFYIYDQEGNQLSSDLDDAYYSMISKEFGSIMDAESARNYEEINFSWALRVVDVKTKAKRSSERQVVKEEDTKAVKEEPVASAIQFCRRCGKKLLPDSVFCSFCGAKIIE